MSDVSYPSCIQWRPSVVSLGYRCPKCIALLWDMDEQTDGLYLENKPLDQNPVCKCKHCGEVVARIIEVKENNDEMD